MSKPAMMPMSTLMQALGHAFRDPALLTLALTHRSVDGQHNNERLEFLGDSILNFIIGEAVYARFPDGREGQLSRMRAALVRAETLAALAERFRLNDYLLLGPGELKTGGGRRESTLSDAMEAIIGAVYVDAGFEVARDRVLFWWAERLNALNPDAAIKDNKTRLQEFLQARREPLPRYDIVSVGGTPHAQTFEVTCAVEGWNTPFRGRGVSRRQAEQQAAGLALESLLRHAESSS